MPEQGAADNLAERVRHLEALEPGNHAKARSDAGQNIPNAAVTIVIFEDEVYDSGAEYDPTTGVFTAGRDGWLHVTSAILYDVSTAWGAVEYAALAVYVNGAIVDWIARETDFSGANIYVQTSGSTTVKLSAGDTCTIRAVQNSGAGRVLYSADSLFNYVCFDWWD